MVTYWAAFVVVYSHSVALTHWYCLNFDLLELLASKLAEPFENLVPSMKLSSTAVGNPSTSDSYLWTWSCPFTTLLFD